MAIPLARTLSGNISPTTTQARSPCGEFMLITIKRTHGVGRRTNGTPGRGEGCNVDANEGDQAALTGQIMGRNGDTNDGHEIFADTHDSGTPKEKRTTTETLDTPNTGEGHTDVDNIGGDGDQEGVADTGVGEESSTVVEDEVDTRQLLPCLECDTSESTLANLVVRGAEAVKP